jgi:hypothetical protein
MQGLDYQHPQTRRAPRRTLFYIWYAGASICALLPVAICIAFVQTARWQGVVIAQTRIQVVDAQTGAPIAGATVQGLDYITHKASPFAIEKPQLTDASGTGSIEMVVPADGFRNFLYQETSFGSNQPVVSVQAPGYQRQDLSPGSSKTRSVLGIGSEPQLILSIALTRVPSTQSSQ